MLVFGHVVVLVVGISSLKIPKVFLIRSAAQRNFAFLAHSMNELMQSGGVRRPSVCPSACLSVCL